MRSCSTGSAETALSHLPRPGGDSARTEAIMRQFLDQYPLDQYHLGECTSPGEPGVRFDARLSSALADSRERERLRRELSRLSADGELDGLLEEIGVSRRQLRLPL